MFNKFKVMVKLKDIRSALQVQNLLNELFISRLQTVVMSYVPTLMHYVVSVSYFATDVINKEITFHILHPSLKSELCSPEFGG